MYRFPIFINSSSSNHPYSISRAQGRLVLGGDAQQAATAAAIRNQARSQSIPTKAETLERISEAKRSNPIVIALKGGLTKASLALKFFEENHINVLHIESRKCKTSEASAHQQNGNKEYNNPEGATRRASINSGDTSYEVLVDLEYDHNKIDELCSKLRRTLSTASSNNVPTIDNTHGRLSVQNSIDSTAAIDLPVSDENAPEIFGVPWFPRSLKDLDKTANRVLMYGAELEADHPGFKDPVYRKRRMLFARIASDFQFGQPIPRIKYTDEENNTWAAVFGKLVQLYPTHACQQYLDNFNHMIECGVYKRNRVPQIHDVSMYLKGRTGFTLRPVAGYLSSRDFLAALAFRVFCCTQYIRHPADPFYSPEPDCCHELLGHMPLFADASFAQFSQEIGLASLGASDDDVSKLATCYFFSVEFGLCRQRGELRIFGAGLLSSANELQHALSDKAIIKPFEPSEMCTEECVVTTFQNNYFYTNSFEEAKSKMRAFAQTIRRPFGVRYNPYTQTVDVLHNEEVVRTLLDDLKSEMDMIAGVLRSVSVSDSSAQPLPSTPADAIATKTPRRASVDGTVTFPVDIDKSLVALTSELQAQIRVDEEDEEEEQAEFEDENDAAEIVVQ